MVDEPTPAPVEVATVVAEAFVRAWARPNLDRANWLAGVARYATAPYAKRLSTVDPANVPAHAVTGPASVVWHTDVAVVVDVPTDAGHLYVTCVYVDAEWLVATVEPVPATARTPS